MTETQCAVGGGGFSPPFPGQIISQGGRTCSPQLSDEIRVRVTDQNSVDFTPLDETDGSLLHSRVSSRRGLKSPGPETLSSQPFLQCLSKTGKRLTPIPLDRGRVLQGEVGTFLRTLIIVPYIFSLNFLENCLSVSKNVRFESDMT